MEEYLKENHYDKKVRKHVSQMNEKEKRQVMKMLNKIKFLNITYHAEKRVIEKGMKVTPEDIFAVWKKGDLVEYEQIIVEDRLSEAVVLEGYKTDDSSKLLKCAIDITNGNIMSMWENYSHDNHKYLDMGIYDRNLKVGVDFWEKKILR